MRDFDAFLKALVANDHSLAEEVRHVRETGAPPLAGAAPRSRSRAVGARPSQARLRTIVMRVGRPVLAVVGDTPQLEFNDSESEVWRSRLQAASARLQQAARAVGRIDVSGHPQLEYVGTGWLVDRDIVLTNRHVAREFSRRNGQGFTFARQFFGLRPMSAAIDFLEETGRADRLSFDVVEILDVEDDDGPDVAFLRVENRSEGRDIAPPIPLSDSAPNKEQQIVVIGYPARDSRIPDAALMEKIFGDVYDKKRLAPGQVTDARADVVMHDCSTLGGNSGSVLLDLATGKAVGIHYAGRFLESNFAVPASVVAERLEKVRRKTSGSGTNGHSPSAPAVSAGPIAAPAPAPPAAPSVPKPAEAGSHEVFDEGVAEEYEDRQGYDPAFLGVDVPMPVVTDPRDVLTFPWKGRDDEHVLTYEHFSVVMNRPRRLCVFSAVNIDGATPLRFKRPGWRTDPRIPKAMQVRDECYGDPPKFARGHMTRREDPIWGEAPDAKRGNSDSMHVTNAVPQMQPFNAGIWLSLEDYALEHAREDSMRIAVFTGPFFAADDPVRDGVLIPRSFWKVIAFIHDETGSLSATGYTMSQETFLREEEFVFAQHRTSQARIATIEQRTGLSFGPLAALDPLHGDEEGAGSSLIDPSQIRFI